MPKENRNFIARKYCNQSSGSQSLYEEAIFDSYDSAYKFIGEISEEDDDCFLSEIVSYLLNDVEPWENEQSWTFDRKATLIRFYDAKKMEENCHVEYHDGYKTIIHEPVPNSFQEKFNIGDIVLVAPFQWNQDSSMPEETVGVISHTPIHYEAWVKQGKDKYSWDNLYMIEFIRDGYVDHMHITESHIKLNDKIIPENHSFIQELAEHFKGKTLINPETLKDIFYGRIFVEKISYYYTVVSG